MAFEVNPAALASTSLYLQAGGAASSAIGSYYSARTQQHQGRMARINARVAELGAESAMMQGAAQVAQLTREAGQLKARQRVSMAANGIDMGVGSAAEILASTDLMKELDAQALKANAIRTAWGYRTEGANMSARSALSSVSPFAAAGGTLLGNAGQVAASWYQFDRMGALEPVSSAQTAAPAVAGW